MHIIQLADQYGLRRTLGGVTKAYVGEIELEFRDVYGRVLHRQCEPNIIKISAKEILAHRIPHSKVWDVNASGGAGAWVTHDLDLEEFAPKYIVFGASFDADGNPLDSADTRYYTQDSVVGSYVPNTLGVGAEYDGGLINAIPIAEPGRPLKRIERIYFEPSYQPAGTPLLQEDVRAINNVVVLETTLSKDEYNGFGLTGGDFFTITEVALVGGREISESLGACECDPRDIFLTGSADGDAFLASASGGDTISLDISESEVYAISEGDQVKIVASGTTAEEDAILDQLNPYYLVISKAAGGRDIILDRTPVTVDNVPLTGTIGVLRDGFRIFSHRIISAPARKNSSTIIVARWKLIMG